MVPPERWVRFPAAWLSPRRLTEPPRTCGVWGRTPPPAYTAGTSPFRGGFAGNAAERIPLRRESVSFTIRCCGWYSSFFGRRQGVAAMPPQVTVSCPLGTTKGLSDRPLETFGPSLINSIRTNRWQGAAALSAAVTITKPIGDAPTSQAEPTKKTRPTQTPAALREGARGRGFSQRSRLPRTPAFPTSHL